LQYGDRVTTIEAAGAASVRVVVALGKIGFDEKSTTFIAPVKRLVALKPDAIFVPTSASQFELIAAQLYSSGLTSPPSAKRLPATPSKPALLLTTADGIGPRFLAAAGRYTQGGRTQKLNL